MRKSLVVTFFVLLPVVFVGCMNIFGFVDNPSGDTQLIAAARACLDRADYACAQTEYGKLSSSNADIKNSETAFSQLDAIGATMGAFIQGFGTGGGSIGVGITKIANAIGPNLTSGTRMSILNTYYTYASASAPTPIANTSLRALTQFVTATALLAELVDELAATPTNFQASDIVAASEAPACKLAAGTGSCSSAGTCDPTTTGKPFSTSQTALTGGTNLEAEASTYKTDFASTITTSAYMIQAVVNTISSSLGALGQGGKYGSSFNGFTGPLANFGIAADAGAGSPCFRSELLSLGVGYTQ